MNKKDFKEKYKIMIDRSTLMDEASEGCKACGNPFNLGDSAVLACGAWPGKAKLIHEGEAVFDPNESIYFERKFFYARKSRRHQEH